MNFVEKSFISEKPILEGKLFFPDGKIRYEGDLDFKNRPNGSGIQYHRNSSLYYEGLFVDGEHNGGEVSLYEDDQKL